MGQKANILTLKTNKTYTNSCTLNSKEFWESNEFVNTFKRSLQKKGVTVTYSSFTSVAKTSYLTLNLYYTTKKLLRYKRKSRKKRALKIWKGQHNKKKRRKRLLKKDFERKKKKNFSNKKIKGKKAKKKVKIKKKVILKTKKKFSIIKNILKNLTKNELMRLKLKLVNKKVEKLLMAHFIDRLQRFKKILFSRRVNLFFDFIKLSSLFVKKHINLNAYTIALGTVFKFLPKKSHSKFFMFTKRLLHKLISVPGTTLKGVKIILNGKLKGKLRSSSFTMSVGKIEAQKISANMDFSKMHIHTLYGCFGLKMWANYKN